MIACRTAPSFALAFLGILATTGAANAQTAEDLKKYEELWKAVPDDVYFDGQHNLTPDQKHDLFRTFAADRKLTAKQKDAILRVGDFLLGKHWRWENRGVAAHWLGDMGHAY